MPCKRSWIAFQFQLFECCFYHSVRNRYTENNCILRFAFNKLWLWWWILMFFATVILLLSCIEITSSNSNFFCLQFDQTRTWWLRCANRLQTYSVSTPAANMMKLYSFNPLWTMITTMFQEKCNMYHISGPIIGRRFSKTCATLSTFEQFSLIHSALQWNAATLRKVLAPFSFSHVSDSCSV